jgi:hypothetical protein
MLSFHLALPREGHLYQLFQVFASLKKYHNTEMVYDPSDPCIVESAFELYGEIVRFLESVSNHFVLLLF